MAPPRKDREASGSAAAAPAASAATALTRSSPRVGTASPPTDSGAAAVAAGGPTGNRRGGGEAQSDRSGKAPASAAAASPGAKPKPRGGSGAAAAVKEHEENGDVDVVAVSEEVAPESITLKVRSKDGDEIVYKVKLTASMDKIFTAFSKRMGYEAGTVRFNLLRNGTRVASNKTVQQSKLRDNDVLEAAFYSHAGWWEGRGEGGQVRCKRVRLE